MTLLEWLLFLPVAQLIALTPGPNNFFAMRNGVQHGVLAAVLATTGRVLAFAILITISAVGLGAMLASSVLAFTILKWVGACYLIYLGIRMWRNSTQESQAMVADTAEQATGPMPQLSLAQLRRLTSQEFLVAISNPKAILLFSAIFPQFIDPAKPTTMQFVLLGGGYLLTEYGASLVYGLGGRQLGRLVKSSTGARRLNRATGGFFIGAGGVLAASSQG
ncbi:LysE family translocator [Marinobacterium arenosum]|uniref:LysE family translocator n=1 Tax=Marinobacterium arenosum TaxID=2862496 RepID=UPI001C97098D|nr:LysE family transporter [Marinobacterium arenosum]MBY4678517.1 LysE family transporter [Marinobacterium arenosum]